jgi:hypothetical protein
MEFENRIFKQLPQELQMLNKYLEFKRKNEERTNVQKTQV